MDTATLPFSELFQQHLQINGAPKSGHLFAYKDQDGIFAPLTKSAFLNCCYEIWKENNMLLPAVIGTLGVAVHTSRTVNKTVGLNCDLKQLEAKPQTTKQHQQHALVVF